MSNLGALYNEAESLKDDGKFEEAIAKLKELLEQDDTHVLPPLALAVVLGQVNNHDDAVKHAQRACELEPTEAFNFTALSVTSQRAWAGTQRQEYIQLAEDAMARAHMLQGQ